jgi:hypothetical protein
MNDLLLSEQDEHMMTKMTKDEKITYLTMKITEFKDKMAATEEENSRLNLTLLNKQRELLELEVNFEEKVRQKAMEFEEIQKVKEKEFYIRLKEKDNECLLLIKEKVQ